MSRTLETLAKSGHMVISGKNGQGLLDFYNGALDTVSKRWTVLFIS